MEAHFSSSAARSLNEILEKDPGVNETYRHAPKVVTPDEASETDSVVLKWYRLGAEELPVPDEIDSLARGYLQRTPLEAKGIGFVILHRCGANFYFLIVTTWRGNNEAWESVYYKDGEAMTEFALWPREGVAKPSFCVWELAVVWHEAKAWERLLITARDQNAAEEWMRDLFHGPA